MEKCVSELISRFKRIGDEHIRDLPLDSHPLQVEVMDFRRTTAVAFIRK